MDETRGYNVEAALCLALKEERQLRAAAFSYFGRSLSYRALLARGERCARALLRWGIAPGEPVFLCASALPELLYCLLGLWRIGAVPHLLHPGMGEAAMARALAASGARLVLVMDRLYPCCAATLAVRTECTLVTLPATASMPFLLRSALTGRLPAADLGREQLLWKDFLSSGGLLRAAPAAEAPMEMPALVCYQGGEARRLSFEELWRDAAALSALSGAEIRCLSLLPPWHPRGVSLGLLAPLRQGALLILESRQRRDCLVETCKREAASHVLLAENQYHWLAEAGLAAETLFSDEAAGIACCRLREFS